MAMVYPIPKWCHSRALQNMENDQNQHQSVVHDWFINHKTQRTHRLILFSRVATLQTFFFVGGKMKNGTWDFPNLGYWTYSNLIKFIYYNTMYQVSFNRFVTLEAFFFRRMKTRTSIPVSRKPERPFIAVLLQSHPSYKKSTKTKKTFGRETL